MCGVPIKMPENFTWGYDDVTDRGKIFFNENFLSGTEKYGKLWTAITSSKIDIFSRGFFCSFDNTEENSISA